MFGELPDGSHQITLHNVTRYGCATYPASTSKLTWSAEKGISYELEFHGITSLTGTKYFAASPRISSGVGRACVDTYDKPTWIATTSDGTEVRLYGVIEDPKSTKTSGSAGSGCCVSIKGTAVYAVVEIPTSNDLSFHHSCDHSYRLFFGGHTGYHCHEDDEVTFDDSAGTMHTCHRRTTNLSIKRGVSLVSTNGFVACQPSGWLAYRESLSNSEGEHPAYPDRTFISFLHGRKVPFFWADQRVESIIRRTYFGWVKDPEAIKIDTWQQSVPLLGGVEGLNYAEHVVAEFPQWFDSFIEECESFDFGIILHPLWTAMDAILQDRLALASVSLERLASKWEGYKSSTKPSVYSLWRDRLLLRNLRSSLSDCLNELLQKNSTSARCQCRISRLLNEALGAFTHSDACKSLNDAEKDELRRVVASRIGNSTRPPNSARLRQPFDDVGLSLTTDEISSIDKRNKAMHGSGDFGFERIENVNKYGLDVDTLRMLITRFVLALTEYKGPYIDYASRPSTGNFEVRSLTRR